MQKRLKEKCPECGHRYCKYPIKDDKGNIIWKNLFRIEPMHAIFAILLIVIIIGSDIMISDCREAVNNPCTWASNKGCSVAYSPSDHIQKGILTESGEPRFHINWTEAIK